MEVGFALVNGWSDGMGDFEGDKEGCTLSPDSSKVRMVPCWKCPKCGHSISKAPEVPVEKQPALLTKASKRWWKQPATHRDLM